MQVFSFRTQSLKLLGNIDDSTMLSSYIIEYENWPPPPLHMENILHHQTLFLNLNIIIKLSYE